MSIVSKKFKAVLSVVLSLIFALSVFTVAASAEGGIESFSINCVNGDEKYLLSWEKNDVDGKYYFYLPAGCDLSSVETRFISTSAIYVGDEKLGYGKKTGAFAGGGEFTLKSGNDTYQVVLLRSANIPAMFIETESGSLDAIHADKSHKEKGHLSVVENGEITLDQNLSSIKGRGNSTWTLDKKPYNIKFDKKVDLFGMGKAKKWSLLASRFDASFLRNTFIFDLADEIGLLYSSKSKHVDLYINGEYLGNYLVCESIEVGSTRVDITNLEDLNEDANGGADLEDFALAGDRAGTATGSIKYVDIPNSPENITGGYLIEFEFLNRYEPEVSGFITNIGQPITLKSPEYATKSEVEYISSLWQEVEDAVYSETGTNSLGKHYTDYLDLESLAKMYIIEEFSMDVDAGLSSCYFLKDSDSDKFYASPVWDFDIALASYDASRNGVSIEDPTKWFASTFSISGNSNPSGKAFDTIFSKLVEHEDFVEAVERIWAEEVLPHLGEEKLASLRTFAETISASATLDNYLWRRKLNSSYDEVANGFKTEAEKLFSFIENRTVALSKGFGADSARLFYEANGGSGTMFNEFIVSKGEKVTLKACGFDGETFQYTFDGWNTEKDGSGTAYSAGDEITLENGKTVLYAQWKKVGFLHANFLKFIELFKTIIEYIKSILKIG